MARILVVEDSVMMADMLCEELADYGFDPVGPCPTVEKALRLIGTATVHAGLLDIRLLDGPSFPVAYCLRDRGIPFVFVSGSNVRELPANLKDEPLIVKPPARGELVQALRRLLKH